MTDSGESKLPLQYEDGPDFCTVRDAQGRDFALTMQPDLMKAMEKALSDEIASFMRAPVKCSSADIESAWDVFRHTSDAIIKKGGTTKQAEIAGLRAAIVAAYDVMSEPQTSWQPIETAPKDAEATFLVCAVGDDRGPFVVRSDIMWQARKAGTPSHLGLSYLTHWMPLPEMPQ